MFIRENLRLGTKKVCMLRIQVKEWHLSLRKEGGAEVEF